MCAGCLATHARTTASLGVTPLLMASRGRLCCPNAPGCASAPFSDAQAGAAPREAVALLARVYSEEVLRIGSARAASLLSQTESLRSSLRQARRRRKRREGRRACGT